MTVAEHNAHYADLLRALPESQANVAAQLEADNATRREWGEPEIDVPAALDTLRFAVGQARQDWKLAIRAAFKAREEAELWEPEDVGDAEAGDPGAGDAEGREVANVDSGADGCVQRAPALGGIEGIG